MGCANGIAALSGKARVNEVLEKAGRHRIPMNAMAELTYKCNVDCVHCYCQHLNEPVKRPELTTDEWKNALDQMAELGVLYLTISGGEVFIRKDFWEIAFHAKKNNFAIQLFTNGTLIDEEKADKLAELRPYRMEMSLLSPVEKMHDLLAKKQGSYKKILNSSRLLKERNIMFQLKTVAMKENVKNWKLLYKIAEEVGSLPFNYATEITVRNDGDISPLANRPTNEQLFDVMSEDYPSPFEIIPDITQDEARAKSTCGAAVNGLGINPYGDIMPCIQLMIPLGNIKEHNLRQVWENPPPTIQKIRETDHIGAIEGCKDCSIINYCKRCHGIAHLETGKWDAKYESGCNYATVTKQVNDYVKGGKTNHPYKKEGQEKISLPVLNQTATASCHC